jgi:hypothetical protein
MFTGIRPMHFPNGTDALVLNCETDISVDDMAGLRTEAEEIWSIFRKDVESAGTTNGVIRITHPEGGGLVTQSKGYGFVIEKRAEASGIVCKMKRNEAGTSSNPWRPRGQRSTVSGQLP